MTNYIDKVRGEIKIFKEVKKFFIIFYAIGITGLIVPFTYPFFLALFPFVLFFNFIALAKFHPVKIDLKTLTVISGIFLLSFAIEVIGVNTGYIFGTYKYGNSLGFKLLNVPLIIGINWVLLIYTTSSVAEKINIKGFPGIIVASSIMVVYDIILEQVAPKIDMWYWCNNVVPLQNYIAWFVIALGFHFVFKTFKINSQNKLAIVILICQFIFFLSLFIFFKLIK
jgi:putative membrane protein